MRAIEFYCGIGGFAAAVGDTPLKVVAAWDQNPLGIETYRVNFPDHYACSRNLEHLKLKELSALNANFWWLSPPCQPFSVRGRRRDLEDPRTASFRRLLELLTDLAPNRRPVGIGLENVAGFVGSAMHQLLCRRLEELGFELWQGELCPTQFGYPMRRPRFYLLASRTGLADVPIPKSQRLCPLRQFLQPENGLLPRELYLPQQVLDRFADGLRLLDPSDDKAVTTCFTSSYGRTLMHSGAFLKTPGGIRRFAPEEVCRLLGFPDGFRFPENLTLRQRWKLVGNSLAVPVVRSVLQRFAPLAGNVPG
ncbi:MAG: DNA methyltransferase [Deltaproteobacteria bacterium]|nr:MAG: DNA methyltransferase [Deltaproteobacteria bacterium]